MAEYEDALVVHHDLQGLSDRALPGHAVFRQSASGRGHPASLAMLGSKEEQVRLSQEEFDVFQDRNMEQTNGYSGWTSHARASFTHMISYGSVLDSCPCGCRKFPPSPHRLIRDGVRGFYVVSAFDSQFRHLTTQEAALFLTISASIHFENEKLGLTLLGQCAAPEQAVWVLAHLNILRGIWCDPTACLQAWLMRVLRSFHAVAPYPQASPTKQLQVWGQHAEIFEEIAVQPGATILDLRIAKVKLAGYGSRAHVLDALGVLPDEARVQTSVMSGAYVVVTGSKAQKRRLDGRVMQFEIIVDQTEIIQTMKVGMQLFEIFATMGIEVLPGSMRDDHGHRWMGDERPLQDLFITQFQYRGCERSFSLSGASLDQIARRRLWQPSGVKWALMTGIQTIGCSWHFSGI